MLLPILALDHQIMALPSSSPNIHGSKIIFGGLAYYQGKKDIVFRFVIEYIVALMDF
jgi:hypothetical protein